MKKLTLYLTIMLLTAIMMSIAGSLTEWENLYIFVLPVIVSAITVFFWAKSLKLKRLLSAPLSFSIGLLLFLIAHGVLFWSVFVFYYIGAAGYEYGARELPAWVYMLWGTIPHTFLSGLIIFLVAHLTTFLAKI